MKKLCLIVLALLFLCSCATPGPSRFDRPGTTVDEMQRDYQACSGKTSSATMRFLGGGLLGLVTAEEGKQWEIERCMVLKNYKCVENCDRGTGKKFIEQPGPSAPR